MKKWYALLLAGAMIITFAACGNASRTGTAPSEESPEMIAPVPTPDGDVEAPSPSAELPSEGDGEPPVSEEPQAEQEPERPAPVPTDTPGEQPGVSTPNVTAPPVPTVPETPAPTQDTPTTTPAEEKASNILIAYFTWADNTVVGDESAALENALAHYESMGDSDSSNTDAVSSASILAPGNAARLAGWIQQEVGGDLHAIRVADPYPSIYDDCLDRAADEKAADAHPTLSSHVSNMEDYDIVFLGFPNWWYTLPMPVLSFVEEYDWSGKTVIPFVTHGTGGLSATVRDLTAALPSDVTVLDPIGVYRPEILSAQPDIQAWVRGLDIPA